MTATSKKTPNSTPGATPVPASAFATTLRSHLGGSLRLADEGAAVTLGGWVHRARDLGGLVFMDLRDRAGLVQVSFNPDWTPQAMIDAAAAIGVESAVIVEGVVAARPADMRNAKMGTGDIEVRATAIRVAGPAATPAIPVAHAKDDKLPSEELRLRHRVLDLRREELQRSLVLRHRLMQVTRRFLSDRGYLEIETPILTKPTPEGARDFLVPSRVHAGEFYALPQSPQIYKQLFMCAGFDRYFQLARCFRDEDLRADRQLEFTQIDIEASFVTREDIIVMAEGLIQALWAEGGVNTVKTPFPRMTYAEAMERYGCDRPDLRYGMAIENLTTAFAGSESEMIQQALGAGGRVRGIRVPGAAGWSRKQVDELEALAKGADAGGLVRLKSVNGAVEGPLVKFLAPGFAERLAMADGELLLAVIGPDRVSSPAMDRVRQECAHRLGLDDPAIRKFLWVLDFPMFLSSVDAESGAASLTAVHHPFTAPDPADMASHPDEPAGWRALAYDCVLNGTELGGGSIRTSDAAVQARMLELLGIPDTAEQERRFGFLLEGLRAGAPPHGGIAFGFDRIAMLLAGASSLRDVIAFPKTTAARALFEGAPTTVPARDLADLHIALERTND